MPVHSIEMPRFNINSANISSYLPEEFLLINTEDISIGSPDFKGRLRDSNKRRVYYRSCFNNGKGHDFKFIWYLYTDFTQYKIYLEGKSFYGSNNAIGFIFGGK